MRYSLCSRSSPFLRVTFLSPTFESPPPPIGTQPPLESSRVMTCAWTRTINSSLKQTTSETQSKSSEIFRKSFWNKLLLHKINFQYILQFHTCNKKLLILYWTPIDKQYEICISYQSVWLYCTTEYIKSYEV